MALGGSSTSARERLTQLAQAVADERSCERLIVGHAHAIDFGRLDAAVQMFTPSATFEILGAMRTGRDEITQVLEELVSNHPTTRHCVSSIGVHTHGDGSADGISYLTLFGAGANPLLVGHLRDRFVTHADAEWRIAHRRLEAVFVDARLAWPTRPDSE